MLHKKWIAAVTCVAAWSALLCQASGAAAHPSPDTNKSMERAVVHPVLAKAGNRWIGVACEPISDDLRAHIDVQEGQGLLVRQVVPGSPAEKAGLAVHDVLLQVNDEPLTSLDTLIKAVADAGDEGIQLQWLHRGETHTKALQPVTRPEQADVVQPDVPMDIMKQFHWRNGDFTAPFQMRFFGPTFEVPPHVGKEFPEDLKVEIKKEGSEPARITVQKGDQRWEVTEDHMEALPEKVRPFVERFVGSDFLLHGPKFEGTDTESAIEFFRKPETRRFFRRFAPFDIEKRLNQIDRRMDQLHDAVRQLRSDDDHSKDTDAKSDDAEPGDGRSEDAEPDDDVPESSV